MWNKHKGINQQWDIIYVSDMPPEPKKGELNTDFGFYVQRPFHIVSQMPDRRYLDIIDGKNIVIKQANSLKSQEWYFDQTTKTVKNADGNNSFNIQNSGRSSNMQIWKTNSDWF